MGSAAIYFPIEAGFISDMKTVTFDKAVIALSLTNGQGLLGYHDFINYLEIQNV